MGGGLPAGHGEVRPKGSYLNVGYVEGFYEEVLDRSIPCVGTWTLGHLRARQTFCSGLASVVEAFARHQGKFQVGRYQVGTLMRGSYKRHISSLSSYSWEPYMRRIWGYPSLVCLIWSATLDRLRVWCQQGLGSQQGMGHYRRPD